MTNHTLSPTRASEYDDNEIVNLTANAHMDDILAVRLSRRSALKGGVSVTAGALLGGLGLSACGGDDDPVPEASTALALGFNARHHPAAEPVPGPGDPAASASACGRRRRL